MNMEGRIKPPEAQPSPGLRTASKTAGVESTISGVSQVMFQDAAGTGSGKDPSSASEGPEKEPGHGEASEEVLPELRAPEQRHPAYSGQKQSSWAPQVGPEEQQAGQDQAKPGSELRVLPSKVPTAHEEMQKQGSEKETEDPQERQQNPGTVECQAPDSCQQGPECQPTPSHQATNGSDRVQSTEPSCTLDSCGQQLEHKSPKEGDISPQGALPEPGSGGHEDSFQEAIPPVPMTTPKEKTANSFPPSTPGPNTSEEGGKAVETKPVPGPVPLPEVRDTGERSELDNAQKQPQEPTVATGAPNLGTTRQGFMKCLLEVEEEEATHRRATKALPNRKSPKTLTPVPTSTPVGNSAPNQPPALPQTPVSAPAMAPSWARLPAPGPIPASVPVTVLPAPALDPGWRRTELLYQSGERSLSYAKARQEPGESGLLRLCQNWEERAEEQLTLKQEEAFRSYFEIFSGQGKVDARSLENILLVMGISLTPAQVEEALRSADIDGDGHVGFKDFLAVMTDTRRFFCSMEQNALTDMALPNPHTLLFEILSLLVEMLALPEAALEEITNYYQRKLKEGTSKAREMDSTIGHLRSRKKLPHNLQQADILEVPERRVLRILSRLKQQNYAANLQSPYAQVPCIPLCPRLDKKTVRRKQGSHYMLDQCTPTRLSFKSGSQGSREYSSNRRKWLSSVPARTH